MNQRLKFVVAAVVVVGGFALLVRADPTWLVPALMTLAVVAVLALIFTQAGLRALVVRRRRTMMWSAAAAIVAGVASPLVLVALAPSIGADATVAICMVLMMGGILLAMAPGMVVRFDRAAAEAPVIKQLRAAPKTRFFRGASEARAAFGFVLARPVDWLRIAGPWVLLLWALTVGGTLWAVAIKAGDAWSVLAVLLGLIVVMILLLLALVTVAVAWSRLVLRDAPPALALPDAAGLGLFWRLIVIFMVVNSAVRVLPKESPMLTVNFGPDVAAVALQALPWGLGLLVCLYLAMAAMMLPARAIGGPPMTLGLSKAMIARLGRDYYIGLAWIGGPWLAIDLGLDRLDAVIGPRADTPPALLLALVRMVMMAVFVAVLATYLSKAYARVKAGVTAAEADLAQAPPTVRPA